VEWQESSTQEETVKEQVGDMKKKEKKGGMDALLYNANKKKSLFCEIRNWSEVANKGNWSMYFIIFTTFLKT